MNLVLDEKIYTQANEHKRLKKEYLSIKLLLSIW